MPDAYCRVPSRVPSGRFVHTRNISGLTEKCAQRMAQVLISGGDGDAPPVHGLPMDQQQQGVGGGVGGGGGQSGAGMVVGSPLMKDHAAHRATPPSTAQVRRTAGGSLFAGGYDHGGAPAPASPLGLSALQGTSVGAGADPMGGSRSPAPHGPGHYIGGTPGMGGFGGGGGGMGHLGPMGGSGGMMSPIQRSIFRGGHDATGGTNRMVPGGSQQPISSPQIRGHTAAGGAYASSFSQSSMAPLPSPVGCPSLLVLPLLATSPLFGLPALSADPSILCKRLSSPHPPVGRPSPAPLSLRRSPCTHLSRTGRISIGGSSAFGSHPFGGATPGHQAFDGSRLPQVRTAAGTATRTPPRSQTASVGFGRPQPPYYSQGGRQSMPPGSGSAVPNHLRPPSLRGMSL